MAHQKMTCHSDVRDFLVGIDYDAIDELHGHFIIKRRVTMPELIEELQEFVENGHNFPTFPACANPTVAYAYDMNEKEDADVYGEVVNELDKSLERSKNGSNN